MRSAIHSAVLALALSVSAAPVEKDSSVNKDVQSSTRSLIPRGGTSGGHWYDKESGPPVFFEDEPSAYKSPSHDDEVNADKPSPPPSHDQIGTPAGQESSVTTSVAIPLFGTIKPGTIKPSTTSTKASSTRSFSTYTSSSSKHTSAKDTRPKATSAHKSSNTHTSAPFHKSSTHRPDSHKPSPHKPTANKPKPRKPTANNNPTLLPARLATPNFKSYTAASGTLMFGMQNPICSAVTLIFARGTTEVGNMGTCVGPDLARELRNLIPSLSVQGVDYPANSAGDTRYGASGGPYMAMLAREARLQCPETKIVLVGYSQGARCLHGALEKSERPFEGGDVAAVVAFGDPLNGKEESFKGVEREDVLQVCGDSDERCQEGRVDLWVHGGHVSYGRTAEKVAEWIRRKVE
jgi:cutinase